METIDNMTTINRKPNPTNIESSVKRKMNLLFNNTPFNLDAPLEEVTGDTLELSKEPVNMDALLKKINFQDTTAVFEKTTKAERKNVNTTSRDNRSTSRSKTIDGLLRDMIQEEVRDIVQEYHNELLAEISNLISRQQINVATIKEPKNQRTKKPKNQKTKKQWIIE